jgi:broad specificity phosphatase PhoE
MTDLCMVRHGQTNWNLEGRYQGQSEVDLNEVGIAQAHTLADKLNNHSFDAVYSSDLQRSLKTAQIIADRHNLSVFIDKRLREINQGEWEGMLVKTIQDRYEQLWVKRINEPADVRPPGGETVAEVAQRVYAALDDIALSYPKGRVLVVSHGLAIATVICKIENQQVGLAYRNIPENAVPVWVHWPVGAS